MLLVGGVLVANPIWCKLFFIWSFHEWNSVEVVFDSPETSTNLPLVGQTLVYQEDIQGHHFEIRTQPELTGLPTSRTLGPCTVYYEGWKLHAERLAWEMSLEKDPYGNLCWLQAQLFQVVCLAVDTSIHNKRWPPERAIGYMSGRISRAGTGVTADIKRYIMSPGKACAYKVDMLKITELRERTKQGLGSKSDLWNFDEVMPENGALLLTLLKQVVSGSIPLHRNG